MPFSALISRRSVCHYVLRRYDRLFPLAALDDEAELNAAATPSTLPWGFVYVHPGALAPSLGQAYQPTQVYEIAADLLIFGFLWLLRRRIKVDGSLFVLYLALYSMVKFTVSFWRQEAIFLFGLQEAQVVALGALAFAVLLAVNLLGRAQVESMSRAS